MRDHEAGTYKPRAAMVNASLQGKDQLRLLGRGRVYYYPAWTPNLSPTSHCNKSADCLKDQRHICTAEVFPSAFEPTAAFKSHGFAKVAGVRVSFLCDDADACCDVDCCAPYLLGPLLKVAIVTVVLVFFIVAGVIFTLWRRSMIE